MSTEVINVPSSGQFEISVDGEPAGLAQYVEEVGRRTFVHTETEEKFAGQGLAGTLVRAALDQTRADGLRIGATCPYVLKFLRKNHDWDDLIDPVAEHT
ncbi:MAG TPA: GNAT family N-acetyltransferase [Sporichthya sp.]|nr:GNAT family N-acetyltransferase [Sporichthya sp.]